VIRVTEYSNRFPFWIFDYNPAEEYEVKPSRKLFGKQRYALVPIGSWIFKRTGHDYSSEEVALPWLNSLNIYARFWKLFDDGDHKMIRELVKHINNETEADLEGHMDRTILADLVYSKPEEVAKAFEYFDVKVPRK